MLRWALPWVSSVSWRDRAPRNIHTHLTWSWTHLSSWKVWVVEEEEEPRSPPVHSTPVCYGTVRGAPHMPTHFSAAPPPPATRPPPFARSRASHGALCPLPHPPLSPHLYLPLESCAPQQLGPSQWCSQRAEVAVQPWVPRPLLCPLHLLLHLQATHTLSLTPLLLHLHPSLMTNPARLRTSRSDPWYWFLHTLWFLQLFYQVFHRRPNPLLV